MARALFNVRSGSVGGLFSQGVIQHPMEAVSAATTAAIVPRDIIHSLSCTYNGDLVLRASLFPAISANPFLSFHVLAEKSGTIEFAWQDDQGGSHSESLPITVE
jgi:sulfur-oxidizing protein SoxZ